MSLLAYLRMGRWPSGRRRTIGNRVYVDRVSRVQIPLAPPESISRNVQVFLTEHEEENPIASVHSQ